MALPLIGLVAANAAISFGTQFLGAQAQKEANKNQLLIDTEQAKLEAAQKGLQLTKQFREMVSYNAAMAAMGIGSDTGLRGTLAVSASNLKDDLAVIERNQRYVDMQAKISKELNSSAFFSGVVGAARNTGLESISLAKDLGILKTG